MGKFQKTVLTVNVIAGSALIGILAFPFLFSLVITGGFGNLIAVFLIVLLAVVNFCVCMHAIHKGEKKNDQVWDS